MLARGAEKLAEAAAAMAGEGGRATVLTCDITDQAALEQAVTTALTEFGAIDILVNNAGSSYRRPRSEEHTSELQSLMRISYAVFCLKKTKQNATKLTSN